MSRIVTIIAAPGLLVFTLLLTAIPASAQLTKFDSNLEWRSIKTRHFWIHYHQGLEKQAYQMAMISERTHFRLSKLIKWEPFWRTDVVLVDNMDMANGYTTWMPFNRVQIFISRPELDSVLNNFDNWLHLVFTHEYTHALNMDTIHGLPAASRYMFGRLCFPNSCLPMWTVEGNAVYHESRDSVRGRNNSTYTDMVMRMEVLDGRLKGIGAASGFPRDWPLGNVPYLYGGLFVEFLERKFGKDSFADIFVENSDNVLPYLVNKNARDVYGVSFYKLWHEWLQFVHLKYSRQIIDLSRTEITRFKQITHSGFTNDLPRFSRDGKALYFIHDDRNSMPQLMQYWLGGRAPVGVARINYPNSISAAINHELVLSDVELYRSNSLYNEVFRYRNGDTEQISSGLRAKYIDTSSDGSRAVFITGKNDTFSLMLSDSSFRERRALIDASDIQIAYSRLSPDNTRVLFTIKDRKGQADLALMDIASGGIARLTLDAFNDIQPAWHPDGKRFVFTSDRSGVYNLYEYDLTKNIIRQLTNMLGGAFAPDVSPNGKLIAFASYGGNGFDIGIMDYPQKGLGESRAIRSPMTLADFTDTGEHHPADKTMGSPYTAAYSLFNPTWLPGYSTEKIYGSTTDSWLGFTTFGTDALYRHFYQLTALYALMQKRAEVTASYMLSAWYPDFILQYKDTALQVGRDDFPWKDENKAYLKRQTVRAGAGAIDLPFYSLRSVHLLLMGYVYAREFTDEYIPAVPGNPDRMIKTIDNTARIRTAYFYSNAREYSFSVSPEDGRHFFVIYDNYNHRLGSDLSYQKVRGEYAEFLPGFGQNHATMFRLRGGALFDNPGVSSPYRLGRYEKGKKGAVVDDESSFGMRGYSRALPAADRLATSALEYRFPLFQRDFGLGTFPLMFRDMWIAVFGEYGNVWNGETTIDAFRSSAGIELHMRLTLGYYLDLEGFIGYARGFNQDGEHQVYFGVSTLWEGAFKQRRALEFVQ